MYEDRTFENIMDEMMEDMPDGVSTMEGSLIYNACAKQAARLEEAYLIMAGLEQNMYADTADLEHLMRAGNDRGCFIEAATYAEFEAQFNCAIPEGSEFNIDEYNYVVFRCVDEAEHIYEIGCDTAGAAPNILLGELEPVEYIEGFEWGKILRCVKEGADEEDEESYRARLLATFDYRGFAGNREYYTTRLKELDGVLGCKLKRVRAPTDRILITIIGDNYRAPSELIVEATQTAVDPIVNSGEGEGIAPVGHRVKIVPVEETGIDIATNISYADGYTFQDLRSYIEMEIEAYFLKLRREWESSEEIVIRILQIETAIVEIEGIVDVMDTTLNGQAANLKITDGSIPIKGELTCWQTLNTRMR